MKRIYIFTGVAIVLIVFCFLAVFLMQKDQEPESKVYVTLMAHIEEGDIYTSCFAYPDYRERLLEYSKALYENGYKMNLQASYQYFEGVLKCETPEMQETTKGMNVIEYLVDEYGFEIDPHHEGSWDWKSEYNFADTRYIGGLVTDEITDIVGLVWDYAPQFDELDACQTGNVHTDFTYCPEIISGAVAYDHHFGDFGDDDPTSGVWIPAGTGDDFTTHDPDGRMVVIGSGPHVSCTKSDIINAFDSEADYVRTLLDYIEEGKIQNQLLTVSVAIPQSSLFGGVQEAAELIRMLSTIRDEDNVEFASYTEIVDVWRDDYNSEPQIFLFDDIDPSDYTCE